ncbi:MAG: transketolase [Alphaproteobacteria bacterium]|nr:transketolase [Alphaproteobacteria bacterium]
MRETSLKMVHELAKKDPRVVFVGSDLGAGALDAMRKEMPERFFMEGVSEAAIIGMAAGLAMDGYIPYVNTIATFITRRCYEQVAVDLCLHNLPVRLIANGGGMVYAPLGPTHMAIEDIAIMRALPNMSVVAVADAEEMKRFMAATLDHPSPIYIRLAKGGDPVVTRPEHGFTLGKAIELKAPGRIGFITTGVMASRALAASEIMAKTNTHAGVLHMPSVKPLDEAAVLALAGKVEKLVTVEEHSRIGGIGSAVAELLVDKNVRTPLLRLALPDHFPEDYGSQEHLLEQAGLSPAAIAEAAAR